MEPMTWIRWRAVLRYEGVIQWRRRVVLFLFVFLIACWTFLMVAGYEAVREGYRDTWEEITTSHQVAYKDSLTEMATMLTFVMAIMLIWTTPLCVADAVTQDVQKGVMPVLSSTPLSASTYLAGKIAGSWRLYAVGTLIVCLVINAETWLLFGAFDPIPVIQMSLFSLIILLYLIALSILLGATQPSRRRAIPLVAVGISSFFLLSLSRQSGEWTDALWGNIWVFLTPYTSADNPYSTPEHTLALLSMVVQLILLLALVGWNLHRKLTGAGSHLPLLARLFPRRGECAPGSIQVRNEFK